MKSGMYYTYYVTLITFCVNFVNRYLWQRVRAVQLFVEHIIIKFSVNDKKFTDLVKYAKRIDIVSKVN